jgi:t-SNARE complex subunit (syntaxin)
MSIMNESFTNVFNDSPLSSIMTQDLSLLTDEELRQFVAKTRELQTSPQSLKAKVERESVKLGARKAKVLAAINDLTSDDEEDGEDSTL